MSLLDALLLDPYRMNVWIAVRTDGVAGTGTHSDPYNGNTAAKFDAVMNGLSNYTRVHLGPGTFQTNGYADGAVGGWETKPGMKIVGSGIDVTKLQLAGTSSNYHYYAIGHALTTGGQPNLMDYFEVSDLTIDCNLPGFAGNSAAAGAVRVMGNHVRVRRIKAINWGTKSSARPCFVVAAITAHPPIVSGVEDCGIEECIVIQGVSATGPVTLLHAGGYEQAELINEVGAGMAPFIRNCFVDAGGESYPFHGLSMAWCKGGIVEGNQVHNMMDGFCQQSTRAQDIVVRNNWFKNVKKGVLLGAIGPAGNGGGLTRSGPTATVTIALGHSLVAGDLALLNTTGTYNGIVVTVLSATGTTFTFNTSNSATSDTVNSVQKVAGVTNSIIEGNVVELALATSGDLTGIHAKDGWGTAHPTQDPAYPTYVFGKVIVRDNKVRYKDGALAANYVGYGLQLNGADDLLVRNNVVDCASGIAHPIRNGRCGSVEYFNNQTPSGTLIQGWNDDIGGDYEELATVAEFATVMSLFNRRT